MRDLYLLRKPWDQRSDRFKEFASTKHPHSSRWNWIGGGKWVEGQWEITERGFGPFGPVTHNLGTTGKVAYLYWRRYEYTLDEAWLRDARVSDAERRAPSSIAISPTCRRAPTANTTSITSTATRA